MDRANYVSGKKKSGLNLIGKKRQSPSSLSDLDIVPMKARKLRQLKKNVLDLPEAILHIVFQYCSLVEWT